MWSCLRERRRLTRRSRRFTPDRLGVDLCVSRMLSICLTRSNCPAAVRQAEEIRTRRDHDAWLSRVASGSDVPIQDPLCLLGGCVESSRRLQEAFDIKHGGEGIRPRATSRETHDTCASQSSLQPSAYVLVATVCKRVVRTSPSLPCGLIAYAFSSSSLAQLAPFHLTTLLPL